MRLRQRDEHAIEWVSMDQRQSGRGAGDAGIERDLP